MQRLVILTVVLALASVCAGCRRSARQTASADIRYRIFEAPADVVDAVIPQESRAQIDGSDYAIAFSSSTNLAVLLQAMVTDSGLLADHTRTISWWPNVADTWVYSRADGTLLGGGGGTGFLGVQTHAGVRKIRVEYDVTHSINTATGLHSKVTYDGTVPPLGVLIALSPFRRTDGTELAHVLAFEVGNWR